MRCLVSMAVFLCFLVTSRAPAAPAPATQPAKGNDLYARANLVAWCIVPFDAKKRTPEERAAMLERMGIRKLAYDWRDEHLLTFDREIAALQKHGVELTAVWFPGGLDANARFILAALEQHKLTPQLWVSAGANDVDAGAGVIRPIAIEAARIGCTVASEAP